MSLQRDLWSVVLLLTATVDPGDTIKVMRRDPAVRLSDYQRALSYWLSAGAARRIVFCENSHYDLRSLEIVAAAQRESEVEFISFSGNRNGAIKGKGYAEVEMMAHALETSRLLRAADIIVKCTGRLTVRNAPQLFRSIPQSDFDVMCLLYRHLSFADSRLFAATQQFFRSYLLPNLPMLDDAAGVYLEHALACAATRAVSERRRWLPFPIYPLIRGISATDGTMTDSALTGAAKIIYHRFRRFVYR
jgi:hypothetical protein